MSEGMKQAAQGSGGKARTQTLTLTRPPNTHTSILTYPFFPRAGGLQQISSGLGEAMAGNSTTESSDNKAGSEASSSLNQMAGCK